MRHNLLNESVGEGGGNRVGKVEAGARLGGLPSSLRGLVLHDPDCFLGAQEGSSEVDVDYSLPLLERELVDVDRRRANACILDEEKGSGTRRRSSCSLVNYTLKSTSSRPRRVLSQIRPGLISFLTRLG
jgi:hypothetical protein